MENVNTIINFSLFRLGGVTSLSIIVISHFNLITFYMIGGVTYRMLPHLSWVPHLHVNSP